MQQTGVGPDAVIGLPLVQLLEPHHPNGPPKLRFGLAGHVRDAARRIDIEALRKLRLAIAPTATSQFQDPRSGRQSLQNRVQVQTWRAARVRCETDA